MTPRGRPQDGGAGGSTPDVAGTDADESLSGATGPADTVPSSFLVRSAGVRRSPTSAVGGITRLG
jgi:hypothetical protein